MLHFEGKILISICWKVFAIFKVLILFIIKLSKYLYKPYFNSNAPSLFELSGTEGLTIKDLSDPAMTFVSSLKLKTVMHCGYT